MMVAHSTSTCGWYCLFEVGTVVMILVFAVSRFRTRVFGPAIWLGVCFQGFLPFRPFHIGICGLKMVFSMWLVIKLTLWIAVNLRVQLLVVQLCSVQPDWLIRFDDSAVLRKNSPKWIVLHKNKSGRTKQMQYDASTTDRHQQDQL